MSSVFFFFFFSSRRRHTRFDCDWSSDVCSSDLTASVVWDLNYDWGDQEWMRTRGGRDSLNAPISIYEVHLGSWMRVPEEHNRSEERRVGKECRSRWSPYH